MKTRDITLCGMLCAVALVLGYIETLLPPFVPIAGFKIGIANIAVMYALYRPGAKKAFFVMIVKVMVSCLWFSGANALVYSLLGGVFSFFAMYGAKRAGFSHSGVGMMGGVFHNVGQLVAAGAVMRTVSVLAFAPTLLIAGMLSGIFVGAVTRLILKHTKTV